MSPKPIKSVASRTQHPGDVTILFNNAGVLDLGSVLDAPPAAFKRNFDVNFFGLLNVTRALAPMLTKHQAPS